jgi:polysaccharide pyruvyl transferase WcaK-like protein
MKTITNKKIKILHFASFTGNVGDNLNHLGFYKSLDNELGNNNYFIEEEEIREFYWGFKKFDKSIINRFNEFDLVVIGGGNYFELWVENSRTGTSIDIPINFLKKINPPIVFFSLGVDIHQGFSNKTKKNFYKFLDYITSNKKYFVSIRNDGAYSNLKKLYGNFFENKIIEIPDSGIKLKENEINKVISHKNLIGINLAGDMIEKRYNSFELTTQIISSFIMFLGKEQNKNIVFFPHILKDYDIIFSVLKMIPNELKRKKISIAPYQNGNVGMKNIFGIYNNCEIIFANRFHSNIASIGLGKPTIGLCNYPQIRNLYKELNLESYLINMNKPDFTNDLKKIFHEINDNYEKSRLKFKTISDEVSKKHDNQMNILCNWIKLNVL